MKVATIRTIDDFLYQVAHLYDVSKDKWWFRGHANSDWDLLPTVRRGFSAEQEKRFANEFYVKAATRHPSCPESDDYAGWLQLMQHYGLPTRLLDWSRSPLVAAFFATENGQRYSKTHPDKDACIWALWPSAVNHSQEGFEDYDYPMSARSLVPLLRPALKGGETQSVTLASAAVEMEPRMQVQQGTFTVHTNDTPLNTMSGNDQWLYKMLIPKKHVKAIATNLELLGFRLGDLFPDLDHLSRELRGTYSPDNPVA